MARGFSSQMHAFPPGRVLLLSAMILIGVVTMLRPVIDYAGQRLADSCFRHCYYIYRSRDIRHCNLAVGTCQVYIR